MGQREQPVVFQCGELHLEGLVSVGAPQGEAAVLCHPHSQYGGAMTNNVVATMAKVFQTHGLSTLRFNFRGVGRSEGQFGDGVDERLDVQAAIAYVQRDLEPRGIHIGGYSFGAYVGFCVACADEGTKGFVGVAPPLALYDFDFAKDYPSKKHVVAGDEDPFCPSGELRAWFRDLREPKALHIIPKTDHFFWGKEDALEEALDAYFSGPAR